MKDVQADYWYSFFFVFSGRDDMRNSGFMWEPGAFAMILIMGIIYNLCKHGIQFNKHIIIYTIALITTFSTAGYLSLGILIILFLFKIRSVMIKFIMIFVLLYSFFVLMPSTDFLGGKINLFIEEMNNKEVYSQGYSENREANRMYSFILFFQKTLLLPTGYGAVEDTISEMTKNRLVGVNGLGKIMEAWGFFGLLVVVYAIYKFCLYFLKDYSPLVAILCTSAICIVFFSNPIERNPILFLIVLTPYAFKQVNGPITMVSNKVYKSFNKL
jgi:hypothetical protein